MGSFSIFHWIILAFFVVLAYLAISSLFGLFTPGKPKICPSCGTVGVPSRKTRGSLAIEIVLWLLFIIPGLIYSLWRQSTRYESCPACGGMGMIPMDTPAGAELADKHRIKPPP